MVNVLAVTSVMLSGRQPLLAMVNVQPVNIRWLEQVLVLIVLLILHLRRVLVLLVLAALVRPVIPQYREVLVILAQLVSMIMQKLDFVQ